MSEELDLALKTSLIEAKAATEAESTEGLRLNRRNIFNGSFTQRFKKAQTKLMTGLDSDLGSQDVPQPHAKY